MEKQMVAASQSLGPTEKRIRASSTCTHYPKMEPMHTCSLSDSSMANHPRGAWTFKKGVRKFYKTAAVRAVRTAVATQKALLIYGNQGTRKTPHRPEGECSVNTSRKDSRMTQKGSEILRTAQ